MKMAILISYLFFQMSIYSFDVTDVTGEVTHFRAFAGKKILIVNIATGSSRIPQLAQLEKLQEKYKDSLVVIAYPSTAYGHETRSDQEIKKFCEDNYHVTFLLAQKGFTTGFYIQPVFKWLANSSENGLMDAPVIGDFTKFLIDNDGKLIGVFAPSVDPMNEEIQSSIVSINH